MFWKMFGNCSCSEILFKFQKMLGQIPFINSINIRHFKIDHFFSIRVSNFFSENISYMWTLLCLLIYFALQNDTSGCGVNWLAAYGSKWAGPCILYTRSHDVLLKRTILPLTMKGYGIIWAIDVFKGGLPKQKCNLKRTNARKQFFSTSIYRRDRDHASPIQCSQKSIGLTI